MNKQNPWKQNEKILAPEISGVQNPVQLSTVQHCGQVQVHSDIFVEDK
jgi:hypothetical protein